MVELKSTFLHWLDDIDDGKTALIVITLNGSQSFECLYWFKGEDNTISMDPELLNMFEVEIETDLVFYHDLLEDIKSILPNDQSIDPSV